MQVPNTDQNGLIAGCEVKRLLKVIIAEDEILFREHLESLIDWSAYGFEIAGFAKNGVEALGLADRIRPDIALLDINMPIMDGLDLSEALKEKYPELCVVLVTGYNEFEYAKKAIRLGVDDYLLKPVDEDELLAAMLKLKTHLIGLRAEKEVQKKELVLKRERILNLLLEGGYDVSEEILRKHLEARHVNLHACSYSVSVIEIDDLRRKFDTAAEVMQCKRLICDTVRNLIVAKGKPIVFNGPEDRIISMIGFINHQEMEAFTPETYRNISWFIKKQFGISVTIGIGGIGQGLEAVRSSYLQSLDALRYKVVSGTGQVMEYSKLQAQTATLGFYPQELNERLVMLLRLNDFEQIRAELDQLFEEIGRKKLSVDSVYASAMGVSSVCLAYLTEMGVSIDEVMGAEFSPMKIITEQMRMDPIKQTVIELYRRTAEYFSGSRPSKAQKAADAVKAFIDRNFTDYELNLSKIAGALFLSPDYIRKVFKQELSISVTEYLTAVRMKRAKELLDQGSVKISSLCYDVGYNDASYFSKCFKKYYGLSPSDYENMHR